jgi:hypothetical protein
MNARKERLVEHFRAEVEPKWLDFLSTRSREIRSAANTPAEITEGESRIDKLRRYVLLRIKQQALQMAEEHLGEHAADARFPEFELTDKDRREFDLSFSTLIRNQREGKIKWRV